jgi:hypothetical protein
MHDVEDESEVWSESVFPRYQLHVMLRDAEAIP